MKSIILSLLLCAGVAHAQLDDTAMGRTKSAVNAVVSMAKGGFSIGASYEYMLDPSTGVGGQLRTFQKHDTGPNLYPGVTILGAIGAAHFYKKNWDLSFTPSFNIISVDSYAASGTKPGDATTMGPGLSVGLTWAINQHVGLGFDYSNYWVWFQEDWRGPIVNDLAFRLKASF